VPEREGNAARGYQHRVPTKPVKPDLAMDASPPPKRPGRRLARFPAPHTAELPRSYPIVQFPNAPLVLAFISGVVADYAHGQAHSDAQAVSYLSIAVWAFLELFQGVDAFRRLLGLTYTISTAIHPATALHHLC
jgi:hypothetical protein